MSSALLEAELGSVPELDVHGMTSAEALHTIDQFLHDEQFAGTKAVRIIHGKGHGVLQQSITTWLHERKRNGLVEDFKNSDHPPELGAVILVAL